MASCVVRSLKLLRKMIADNQSVHYSDNHFKSERSFIHGDIC